MSKKFDLEYLFVEMSSCYEKSDHLDMDSYLRAYAEFNKYISFHRIMIASVLFG